MVLQLLVADVAHRPQHGVQVRLAHSRLQVVHIWASERLQKETKNTFIHKAALILLDMCFHGYKIYTGNDCCVIRQRRHPKSYTAATLAVWSCGRIHLHGAPTYLNVTELLLPGKEEQVGADGLQDGEGHLQGLQAGAPEGAQGVLH